MTKPEHDAYEARISYTLQMPISFRKLNGKSCAMVNGIWYDISEDGEDLVLTPRHTDRMGKMIIEGGNK